jgi:hypothetical protein
MDVKMYKSILFIALLMIVVMPTFAQNVQIEYSEKINTDVPTQLSLKLDNKTYLKIDVQADLSSKQTAIFNFYTAKNGVVSKFDMGIPAQMSGISIKNKEGISIEVMMKQQQDSVALSFAVDGRVMDLMIPRNYTLPFPEGRTCNYVPMETYLDQAMDVNDEIPIFAVTGGICGAMDFMGTPMFTQDYCGLRDKHQHPKEWVNIDDVHNYCFYTIEFH